MTVLTLDATLASLPPAILCHDSFALRGWLLLSTEGVRVGLGGGAYKQAKGGEDAWVLTLTWAVSKELVLSFSFSLEPNKERFEDGVLRTAEERQKNFSLGRAVVVTTVTTITTTTLVTTTGILVLDATKGTEVPSSPGGGGLVIFSGTASKTMGASSCLVVMLTRSQTQIGRVFALTQDQAANTSEWLAAHRAMIDVIPVCYIQAIFHAPELYYHGFLATIHDTTSDISSIHDQPIVSEFQDVFSEELPGIPPIRDVEFNIELIPGAEQSPKLLSHLLAPIELKKEHEEQSPLFLQDFTTREIILPSFPTCEFWLLPQYCSEGFFMIALPLTQATRKGGFKIDSDASKEGSWVFGINYETEVWLELLKDYDTTSSTSGYKAVRWMTENSGAIIQEIIDEQDYRGDEDVSRHDLKQHFWWSGMKRDVATFVSKCLTCQQVKIEHQRASGLLQPLEIPVWKWDEISMDFVTGLPRTQRKHDAIWVVVDRLTKSAHFLPIRKDYPVSKLAEMFQQEIVRLHGTPSAIVSDRDPRFTSRFWKGLQKAWGTRLKFSTAFHPETDGQSERTIQTLEDMLRSCALEWAGNWDDYICLVEFAYNNSWHASIKCAPFEMLYGRKCRAPICWDQVGERILEGPEMIEVTNEKVAVAREKLKEAQTRQKSYADRHRRALEFQPGEHVFLKVSPTRGVRRFGIKGKLSPRFIGPFEILDRVGEVSYRLALPPQLSHVHNVFHVSLLRGYKYHPLHVVSYPFDQIREDLSYTEEPESILDRQDRVMRNKTIPFVKILWRNHPEREATWETEESIRTSYPHFLP
ncbi:putative nucleotidyltransferase, ribonuclease H [Tanacetum coccineum]